MKKYPINGNRILLNKQKKKIISKYVFSKNYIVFWQIMQNILIKIIKNLKEKNLIYKYIFLEEYLTDKIVKRSEVIVNEFVLIRLTKIDGIFFTKNHISDFKDYYLVNISLINDKYASTPFKNKEERLEDAYRDISKIMLEIEKKYETPEFKKLENPDYWYIKILKKLNIIREEDAFEKKTWATIIKIEKIN